MSSKGKAGFKEYFYGDLMPKIYGIGASVVILGAMFKILDLPGASIMIGTGLGTEAVIFFLSAFEPKHAEADWELFNKSLQEGGGMGGNKPAVSGTQQLDKMLADAKIGPELINSLGQGMKNLADNASKMNSFADASVATAEYTKNIKTASTALLEINKSYATTAEALTGMSAATVDAKQYQEQVVKITKNLGALNAVYELELQDANSHLKAMNKFYANINTAMESMNQASKETESFKAELGKLNQNIGSLNKVYGGMLSAMKA